MIDSNCILIIDCLLQSASCSVTLLQRSLRVIKVYKVGPSSLANPPLAVGERRVQVSACIDLLCCLTVRQPATATPAEREAMAAAAAAASVWKLVFSVVWV